MGSLMGKVAADHSHKWIYREPHDHEINILSAWHSPVDCVSQANEQLAAQFDFYD